MWPKTIGKLWFTTNSKVSHLNQIKLSLQIDRLYLGDKELNVTSFSLLLSVLEYQTAVMRRDFETADRVLPTIMKEHRTRVAHFLEKQGFKQQALQVSTDNEHRFDLALQIGDLNTAIELARETENPQKWSQLAEVATKQNQFDLVKECLGKANDFGGLLLLATSSGDADMIRSLGENGAAQGKHNISFLSMFLLGDLEQCLQILIDTNRLPEAAFFARTYIPSKISYVVQLWRNELAKINEKAGQSLADPEQYENLFPGLHDALKTEQYLTREKRTLPATLAPQIPLNIDRRAFNEMQEAEDNGTFEFNPNQEAAKASDETQHSIKSESFANRIISDQKLDIKSDPSISINAVKKEALPVSTDENLLITTSTDEPVKRSSPPPVKRKNSLDEFDLEIEGINLDDNLDTSVGSGILLFLRQ